MAILSDVISEIERSINSKVTFLDKLPGIPETDLYRLLTLLKTWATDEEKLAAAECLRGLYFKCPIRQKRQQALGYFFKKELQERANEKKTTRKLEKHSSALTGIFLALGELKSLASFLPYKDVHVPEWSGNVRVRAMTPHDRMIFFENNRTDLTNVTAKILIRSLSDENGNRLFLDSDHEELGNKSGIVLNRLLKAAYEVNLMAETREFIEHVYIETIKTALNKYVSEDLLHMETKTFTHKKAETEFIDEPAEEIKLIEWLMLDTIIRTSDISEDDIKLLNNHFVNEKTFVELSAEGFGSREALKKRCQRIISKINKISG